MPSVSQGAAAGIGIGCAIAGAVIVLAVFLLPRVFRRRPKRKSLIPLHITSHTSGVLDDLPQAIAHEELKREFSQIETQIKNFVSNFFQLQSVSAKDIDDDKLRTLMGTGGGGTGNIQWSTQLRDKSTRSVMLRSYVARVLLTHIDPRGVADTSLLPTDMVRCYQAALIGKGQSRSPQLLEYWRSMTAFLISKQYPQDKLAHEDPRLDNIKRVVADLLDVLQPFRNSKSEGRAYELLETIAVSAALLGLKLFAETNPVEIVWPPASGGQIATFPALRQQRLKEGRKITIKRASFD
ncbi:hypothetical protein F5Y05DRAFT_407754 [Hypoxylon sp. FL0543]|nr:hypothetical protein F5Y05DRAFT_407754 [Hypoxylon sp. FL0543]